MGSLGGIEGKTKPTWVHPRLAGFTPSERWGTRPAPWVASSTFSGCVGGGCSGGLHFGEVLTFDLKTMAWSSMATTGRRPESRDSHSAATNELHILDLLTGEWSRPICDGVPPCPTGEPHATIVGEDKLLVFGGSGDGEGNYLNDVHILDLKTATSPPPLGSRLLVYGGDCGDRYYGEVDILDVDTLTWYRVPVIIGPSPGARAGHAAVNLGNKRYYSDVWVLDLGSCSWVQLDVGGRRPQGRFSHTAVVAGSDVAVYGGCGEDERPLSELVILQLGAPACKIFGCRWSQDRWRFPRGKDDDWEEDMEEESEQEEHSLSLSQHSSPSQSDQEQNSRRNMASALSTFKQKSAYELFTSSEHSLTVSGPCLRRRHRRRRRRRQKINIGAEVRGSVDGAFDSGYLMTAKVNGLVLRGVLFAPVIPVHLHQARPTPPPAVSSSPDSGCHLHRPPPEKTADAAAAVARHNPDLQGVVLTLGGPAGEQY
ncbi:unnamed protein product [Spirodela intermedia]|uniref:Uncharacterized protein n=1 Tax=Spirodela intermedia TaxID=51605 RepID=A0A7I8I8M2_SPIIN|nr:unnamed protein product [Spirodela intermedia]CAA6653960.1 unnamed protein product [Spirodela intermedia]